MASVRAVYAAISRRREDCDAQVAHLRRRAAFAGLSEAGREAAPSDISMCKYDRPECEPWYAVEGLAPGLIFHTVAPNETAEVKRFGILAVEEVGDGAGRLSDMLVLDVKTAARARQHITVTYHAVFANSDWRVAVGTLNANSYQMAVVVDVAYLPFSATAPPLHANALFDDMAALLDLTGLRKLADENASLYAKTGLPEEPLACSHATPYMNLAMDLTALAVEACAS
eukprot:TRINITY_DN17664_c0_g1_i1.p1 TRINITY_DN17664_c0_g1~~TRINITY_DN17664_c0_g1_i1.p1  ORF type:complete len:246 (+),score=84.04 TRINITY_DN17664_c0_g1_i1:55-738(+)